VNIGSDSIIGRLWHCYFLLFAFLLGAFILSGITWLLPAYFSISYIVLGFTFLSVTRFWREWLNPLSIVLIAGLIRFTIPGFLSFRTDPDFSIFQIMDLERDHWIRGHALALAGLLGVGLGWLMPMHLSGSGRSLRRIGLCPNLRSSRGLPYAAMLGMLIGLAALILFIGSHVPVSEAVSTGEMRGTEVRAGTGKYFHLSLMLIASSVVFSAYLIERRYSWFVTSLPAVVAAASFWVLGGRVRAIVPMACVALLLWYRRNELKVPVRTGFVLSLILLPVFSYVGQLYRGGMGLEAFSEIFSVSSLIDYVNYAVWLDWGQLHALAGAVAIGPGVLGGQTFTALLWPLTKFVDLPGKSAGVFIVQTLVGYDEEKWAFHATLIGDAYLNFGVLGVFVVTAAFGFLLRKVYVAFKQGTIGAVYYSLVMVYGLRIFFESVEEWSEGLEMMVYAYLLIRFGPILFNVGAERGVSVPSEKVAVMGHRYRY
jgi:hypothetical protein